MAGHGMGTSRLLTLLPWLISTGWTPSRSPIPRSRPIPTRSVASVSPVSVPYWANPRTTPPPTRQPHSPRTARMAQVAVIRCPACGVESQAEMPDNACVYFWDCPACRTVVRPKAGACCVFCSYGSQPCPPSANR